MATHNFTDISFFEANSYNLEIARTRQGSIAGREPVNELNLVVTGTGNVTSSTSNTTLTSAASSFGTNGVAAGHYIDTNESTPRRIGVIASVTNNSTAVLTANGLITWTGGFLIRKPTWVSRTGSFLVRVACDRTAPGAVTRYCPSVADLRVPKGYNVASPSDTSKGGLAQVSPDGQRGTLASATYIPTRVYPQNNFIPSDLNGLLFKSTSELPDALWLLYVIESGSKLPQDTDLAPIMEGILEAFTATTNMPYSTFATYLA